MTIAKQEPKKQAVKHKTMSYTDLKNNLFTSLLRSLSSKTFNKQRKVDLEINLSFKQ